MSDVKTLKHRKRRNKMFEKFKNFVAKVKIEKANTSLFEERVIYNGATNVDAPAFVDAVKLIRDLGISVFDGYHFDNHHRHGLTIIIDDEIKGRVCVRHAFEYAMSRKTFMKFYHLIIQYGVNGRILVRALADAVDSLPINVMKNIIENNGNQSVNMFITYIEETVNHSGFAKNFGISPNIINNMCNMFGGYKGIRQIFVEALHSVNKAIECDDDIRSYVYKNKCLTCKYCKFDIDGFRYCKYKAMSIPTDMSTSEIQNAYRDVYISNGTLYSKYVPFPLKECIHFKPRTNRSIKE